MVSLVKRTGWIACLLASSAMAFSLQALGQASPTGAANTEMDVHDERQTKTFKELDANNDGLLDEDEVMDGDPRSDFTELDEDGDGEINRNEYFQYHRQQGH